MIAEPGPAATTMIAKAGTAHPRSALAVIEKVFAKRAPAATRCAGVAGVRAGRPRPPRGAGAACVIGAVRTEEGLWR
jgi:hypothetical protein